VANETQTAFISYSREDSEFALKLAGDLKAAGAAVWLDQLDIATGQPWDAVIERALIDCPRLMVVLSPAAIVSPNVQDEVSFALQKWKAVVPVLYRDCEIPYRLHRLQQVDFRKDYARGLQELVEALTDTRTLTPGQRLGHWRRQLSGVRVSHLSLAFPTQELGWAASSYGLMLRTDDGGSTWTQQESEVEGT
jgi:TIR domain